MALLRVVANAFETAGHGIATGAVALADEVTRGQVPELRDARRDQERRLQLAARGVAQNARVVGGNLNRILGTTGVSALVLARIISHPEQLRRIVELVETHDFLALLRALQSGAHFPDDFFPNWVRRAGGYFPKFAQVLSVRGDLIHNCEILTQFARCLEDMPTRPNPVVWEYLLSLGWDQRICDGVGEALNAGTVAQVNALAMPDGRRAAVKVAWPDTRKQMQTDFRLFSHGRDILAALRLDDEQAHAVAAMFAAVSKSEAAVMREFNMQEEAQAMLTASALCSSEWDGAYQTWVAESQLALAGLPPALAPLATLFVGHLRSSGWAVKVPEPLGPALCCESALAMSLAGGESLHKLLSGASSAGDAGRQEAAGMLIGFAVPFIGWLLLCKSTSHLAHVDPHPGNFRWDSALRTLWVLDWGSNVTLTAERRLSLCMLVSLIAAEAPDDAIADTAVAFGVRCTDPCQLARLWRGMLNATSSFAAQDAINVAAIDNLLDDVSEDVVPVVRCLATLGGLLKELQQTIRDEQGHDVPLSLAKLWATFAAMGLQS